MLTACKAFLLLLLFAKLQAFFQNQYTIKHEILELNDYNREYFENFKFVLYWYNRTARVYNATTYLLKNLGPNLQLEMTLYKFSSNQFLPFPGEFKRNLCGILKTNLFGLQDVSKIANITDCPIRKGFYNITNFKLDESKFPPNLIPFGRYKICPSLYNGNDYLFTLTWYGEVKAKGRFVD